MPYPVKYRVAETMRLRSLTTRLLSFLDGNAAAKSVTQADVARQYRRPPSFTDLLPWMEYLPESRSFLLEDGLSVGALFELTPIGVEARTPQFMAALRDGLQMALTDALPEDDESPWILQVYVQDEPRLHQYLQRIDEYIQASTKKTAFTRHYLRLYEAHLQRISRPGGLFRDTAVTGERWQGKVRRVRLVLYRRCRSGRRAISPVDDLNDVAERLEAAFGSTDLRLHRAGGRNFYDWMLLWFNPRPEAGGDDPTGVLKMAPYPGDENLPFGSDLAESLTLSMPRSDKATGSWWFDGLPHRVISVQGLRRKPQRGLFG